MVLVIFDEKYVSCRSSSYSILHSAVDSFFLGRSIPGQHFVFDGRGRAENWEPRTNASMMTISYNMEYKRRKGKQQKHIFIRLVLL
jgi:hypothetical protein